MFISRHWKERKQQQCVLFHIEWHFAMYTRNMTLNNQRCEHAVLWIDKTHRADELIMPKQFKYVEMWLQLYQPIRGAEGSMLSNGFPCRHHPETPFPMDSPCHRYFNILERSHHCVLNVYVSHCLMCHVSPTKSQHTLGKTLKKKPWTFKTRSCGRAVQMIQPASLRKAEQSGVWRPSLSVT